MKRHVARMVCGLAWGIAAAWSAHASSPTEKVVCTQVPRSEWLSEARIKNLFGVRNFTLVKLKVSRGNCYEFYAVHRDGSIVEAYYDPVSGEAVRYNRILVKPAEPGYEARSAAPAR